MSLSSWALTLSLVAVLPVLGAVNEAAIAEVAAGQVKEAKASWWGYDPADATAALQAAINSGVPKLVVDKQAGPWIVDRMTLASNQEILFEDGVEVRAKRGAFTGTSDSLFAASQLENITLTGYGATLRMWRSDYDAAPYQKAEWRHVLNIKSCRNIKIHGLTLTESGGDGIYLGVSKAGVPNRNVHIKDVVCDRNYRQGISVISAEDLLIENTRLTNTAGTAPQAGIDFEPNHESESIVRCVMRNCVAEGNRGAGFVAYLVPLGVNSPDVSLRLENCRSKGNSGPGFHFGVGNDPARTFQGSAEFVDCVSEGDGTVAASVADKPVDGCAVTFERCSFLADPATGQPKSAMIAFSARQTATQRVGGVVFRDCLVRDSQDRRPMRFQDQSGLVGIGEITGSLLLEQGGEKRRVELTPEVLGQWIPAISIKPVPRLKLEAAALRPLVPPAPGASFSFAGARLRKKAEWVLYASAGDQVKLQVMNGQVGKYAGIPLPLTITGPTGQAATKAEAVFGEPTEVQFQATETGLYTIQATPPSNYVQVRTSSHPIALSAAGGPLEMFGSTGEFWFWVPAGTREFAVRVTGSGPGEAVKATLCRPDGTVVEEQDNLTEVHQFLVTLDAPSPGEAWRVRFAKPSQQNMEDFYADLLGIPPLLAPSREALIVPR